MGDRYAHRGIAAELRPQFVRVRSYRNRQEQIGEDFERGGKLPQSRRRVIVVLGGIAVSSVTRGSCARNQEHRRHEVRGCDASADSCGVPSPVARARPGRGLMGVVLAVAAIAAIPSDMNQIGTLTVPYGLSWSSAAQGFGNRRPRLAVVCDGSAPRVPHVKPSLLCARDQRTEAGLFQIGATAVVAAALIALASWQAASIRVGVNRLRGIRRSEPRAARRGMAVDSHDEAVVALHVVSDASGSPPLGRP